ncbi:MAG: hypothetical protein WC707_04115 [Candidatus Babeliaceae bacterium]|jgi:hypothetical protein
MNKILLITIASITLILSGVLYKKYINERSKRVLVYTGDQVILTHHAQHVALLGCTPHPTAYLKRNNNNGELLRTLKLEDFLDIEYLKNSFERTFSCCKEQKIDHLIIAYLPVYYVDMRELLGKDFVQYCRVFLNRMAQEMPDIIEKTARASAFTGTTTLVIPPDYQLERVPHYLNGMPERIKYLIKQFPRITNKAKLETITVINNTQSQEDDMLIDYLQYEYLYEKPITYKKCVTGKDRFHKYTL